MILPSATPAQLLQSAIGHGLEDALDQPLMDWLGSSTLSPRPRGVLQALAVAKSVTTPRRLLETPQIWQALGSSITPAILDDLASWLARVPGPRVGPPLPPVGRGPELRAWAEARHLLPELERRATVLDERVVGRARYWFWRRPSATIAEALTGTPGRDPDAVPTEIQEAAQDWLAERAERVERGLLDEQAVLDLPAPDAGPLRTLFERVRAARADLRKTVLPVPRDELSRVRVEAHDDPPRWTLRDGWPGLCERTRGAVVTMQLQGPALLTCSCDHGAACPLGLVALDALALTLAGPDSEARRWIALQAGREPWTRLLDDLGEIALDEREPITLGWRYWPEKRLVVPVACTPKKRGGGWKTAKITLEDLAARPEIATTPPDREARALVLAAGPQPAPWVAAAVLARLVGHPRFSVDAEAAIVERATLRVDWEPTDDGARAVLRLGERELSPDALLPELRRQIAAGFAAIGSEAGITVFPVDPALVRMVEALARRGVALPTDAIGTLFDRLPRLGVDTRLAPELRGETRRADDRPVVRVDTAKDGGLTLAVVVRPAVEGPAFPPGEGPRWVYLHGHVSVERDLEGEPARAREALSVLPLPAEDAPFWWVLAEPDAALEVVHALQASALTVEWVDPSRVRRTTAVGPGSLRLNVRKAREWLEVSGSVEVDGATLELAEVLAAVLAGRRYVAADAHTWVRLSDELTRQLGAVAAAGGERLPTLAAPLVEGLREGGARVDDDEATRTLMTRARTATTAEIDLPPTLQATLRPYQVDGFRWMARLASWAPGACLADDMGLGKTVQAITLLLTRPGPTLVVAPTSVGFNWLRELARFAPSLRARALRGAGRLELLDALGPDDVLVTSWDLLARDIESLEKIPFGTLVLDEAQAMKNPSTARAKAAARLDAGFRLALTGTPVENRVSELWSLFRVVAPGLLGSWDRFRERFAAPIERDGDAGRREALSRLIRPFVLRRLKRTVAEELPPRTDLVVEIELSEGERRLYDATRTAALQGLSGPPDQRRFQVLAALTRLRQAACHPRLLDPDTELPSSKLERLRELLAELRAEGHRALVFSQFTRHLALVRDALTTDGFRLRYLDGETPEARRRAEVDAFQAGDGEVFLISLKAGGVGLNLTAASYVFHLDPWWNPAAEDQASDRAHRIGQTLPVTVCRLVSTGTIEEKILALHAEKRELVEGLLSGTGDATGLSVEELVGLLEG